MVLIGIALLLAFIAIVMAPPRPRPEMTTAELNRGCRLSCGSLLLIITALGLVITFLIPLMELAP